MNEMNITALALIVAGALAMASHRGKLPACRRRTAIMEACSPEELLGILKKIKPAASKAALYKDVRESLERKQGAKLTDEELERIKSALLLLNEG